MGKESEKEYIFYVYVYIYIYIHKSLKLTQHSKSTIIQ